MCPYSALGVLSEERVSKRLTSFSRRLITSAGTSSASGVTASISPPGP